MQQVHTYQNIFAFQKGDSMMEWLYSKVERRCYILASLLEHKWLPKRRSYSKLNVHNSVCNIWDCIDGYNDDIINSTKSKDFLYSAKASKSDMLYSDIFYISCLIICRTVIVKQRFQNPACSRGLFSSRVWMILSEIIIVKSL